MENPFEIINNRLERIEKLLKNIYAINDIKNNDEKVPEIMNVKEVASYLSIKPSAVYQYASTRVIPHYKRGKRLYFQKNEINNWVFENKRLTNKDIEKMADEYLLKNPL